MPRGICRICGAVCDSRYFVCYSCQNNLDDNATFKPIKNNKL